MQQIDDIYVLNIQTRGLRDKLNIQCNFTIDTVLYYTNNYKKGPRIFGANIVHDKL